MEKLTNWFQTYTGKLISVTDPKPSDVDIVDIAHALSMTCRFGGHCRDFYSVAEHSVHVYEIGKSRINDRQYDRYNLALLLHDAAEAYIGDLITPLKRNLGGVPELEWKWLQAIEQRYNLESLLTENQPDVKKADLTILSVEILSLFDQVNSAWWEKFEPPTIAELHEVAIKCWSPPQARREFLQIFTRLRGNLGHYPGP